MIEEGRKGSSDRCPRCGHLLEPEDMFCGHCGKGIREPDGDAVRTMETMKVGDVLMGLGIVCLKKGDYFRAIEKFEKIIAADPDNRKAGELLSRARRRLRDLRGEAG